MCVEKPVRIEPPESAPAASTDLGPFRPGQIVAEGYRITRVLGCGGIGVVYEAADLVLPRTVAIKTARFASHAHALRLEAQALAAVRHPGFVTIHHVAREGDLEVLVLERLYGDTLADRIDELRAHERRFSLPEALDLLIALADALSAAHRAGVAHRDLKPANVILSGERVVVVDLGLFVPEVLVGPENVPAGSAYTIAPEVLLRSVEKGRGPLVDLYAFGAIAFEVLTGVPPFLGDSLEQVLAAHVSAPVPDPRVLRPEIPDALAALVRELLAKDPEARPSGAEAVLWQLKDLRAHGAGPSARPTVLVVDDDPGVGVAVRRSLEQAFPQLSVRSTTAPEEGLPRGGRAPADVLVVDVDMPRINGIEICMAIHALPPAARPAVIVMSGTAGPHEIEVLHALGVDAFVPKDERLLATVGKALGVLRSGARTIPP